MFTRRDYSHKNVLQQIEEKSLNEFSLLMFGELTARHSGDYTCRVANHAAVVNYTATLAVRGETEENWAPVYYLPVSYFPKCRWVAVAPSWLIEPQDAIVVVGAPLELRCAAAGQPAPALTWHRRHDEGEADYERRGTTSRGTLFTRTCAGAISAEHWAEVRGAATQGALALGAAARHMAGLYRCSADNGVGPPLLKHINVVVQGPWPVCQHLHIFKC